MLVRLISPFTTFSWKCCSLIKLLKFFGLAYFIKGGLTDNWLFIRDSLWRAYGLTNHFRDWGALVFLFYYRFSYGISISTLWFETLFPTHYNAQSGSIDYTPNRIPWRRQIRIVEYFGFFDYLFSFLLNNFYVFLSDIDFNRIHNDFLFL